MDPRTATQLEEIDMLRFQNWQLRKIIIDAERETLLRRIDDKYRVAGEQIDINLDTGAITRTQEVLKP